MKQVVTVTGIRPDFIRMAEVFRQLDVHFDHRMVHTGQHYDDALSKIIFDDLQIRTPNYRLAAGGEHRTHYEQLSYLSTEIFALFKREKLSPDLVLFLGDSNSVMISPLLFKEGYRVGHIEGGMRSYDRRMPEEVNRVICDYVSEFIFVYTEQYKQKLLRENKPANGIFVVGNTITEIVRRHMPTGKPTKDYILADIHRNENLKTPRQYRYILEYLQAFGSELGLPVRLVKFARANRMIEQYGLLRGLPAIEITGPHGFLEYLRLQYNARAVVSDSGTCQEECPLLGVPALVPRNATERPESMANGNSLLIGEDRPIDAMVRDSMLFVERYSVSEEQLAWLGDGKTAVRTVGIIKEMIG